MCDDVLLSLLGSLEPIREWALDRMFTGLEVVLVN
jgi:hypothetical protein